MRTPTDLWLHDKLDFHQLATPGKMSNPAVLRMLEEEERQRGGKAFRAESPRQGRFPWPPPPPDAAPRSVVQFHPGVKKVLWPPPPEEIAELIEDQPIYSKGSAPLSSWYAPPKPVSPPPATVVLLPEAPVRQSPPPVYSSQPAATKSTGVRMRGDAKWPPESVKAQTQAENEARLALAKGPAFRPKRPNKDYTQFFAQHALTSTYPGYRVPPGTQHYVEEGTSNF